MKQQPRYYPTTEGAPLPLPVVVACFVVAIVTLSFVVLHIAGGAYGERCKTAGYTAESPEWYECVNRLRGEGE